MARNRSCASLTCELYYCYNEKQLYRGHSRLSGEREPSGALSNRSQFSPAPLTLLVTEHMSLWQSKEHGEAMNQHDGSLAAKHAAVVRWAIARQIERIDRLEALGFSTVGAERALEDAPARPEAFRGTRTQTSHRRHTASARLTGSQVRVASVSP